MKIYFTKIVHQMFTESYLLSHTTNIHKIAKMSTCTCGRNATEMFP